MNKPKAVAQLLEELQGEAIESHIDTLRTSKVVIYVDEDDEKGFSLNSQEARLVFANEDTAQRLADALERPASCSICLFDITPEERVLSVLERSFAAIDEG